MQEAPFGQGWQSLATSATTRFADNMRLALLPLLLLLTSVYVSKSQTVHENSNDDTKTWEVPGLAEEQNDESEGYAPVGP
jgi:hypothetical protein